MSHKVHPYSHRLGILRDWKSRWFGRKGQYQEFLRGDILLREYLEKQLRPYHVSTIDIERNEKAFRVIIETSRPGMIIGRNGEGADKLRASILAYARRKNLNTGSELKLDIREVRSPESNAAIVGKMIAEGLEKRMPFRRVMKQTVEKVMANRDVKGVRAEIGGRLGGAEIARTEKHMKGQVPLQTLRADIDFAREEALLPYGKIGIKVWIYKGEVFEKDVKVAN